MEPPAKQGKHQLHSPSPATSTLMNTTALYFSISTAAGIMIVKNLLIEYD